MILTLRLDNATGHPGGEPTSITVTDGREVKIGRDPSADWTLPDPTRAVSGRHCEIRFQNGAYWLHDVSTNGTYLYGTDIPLRSPYQLRNGDRLEIGPYVVAVTIADDSGMSAPPPRRQVDPEATRIGNLWDVAGPPSASPTVAPANRATSDSPSGRGTDSAELIRRFALGAGIPPSAIQGRDAGALAEEMGLLVKFVASSLTQLLAARAETKRMARSANHTMIQPQENNPLKFAPTVEEALQLMFGARTSGFLDAQHSFQESFRDLNAHQIKTFSAMQHAVRMLAEDLDPDAISETVEADRGIGSLVGSRKAKLWDAYVTRWQAKTAAHGNGLVDAFMNYFAEIYERGGRDK